MHKPKVKQIPLSLVAVLISFTLCAIQIHSDLLYNKTNDSFLYKTKHL